MCVTFFAGFLMKLFLIWYLPEPLSEHEKAIYIDDHDDFYGLFPSPKEIKLLSIDYPHFLYGSLFIGFISSFQFFFSYFTTPRFRFRTGNNRRTDYATAIILAVFIALGLYKAFKEIYAYVKAYSKRFLKYVEGVILDVNE
jgi:hypothetical protein